jgi:DnaK suppressor protein
MDTKTVLEQKKQQLEEQLSLFAKKDPQVQGDWDAQYPRIPGGGLEEAADEVEEYSQRLHLEFQLETQLKHINEALARIEKGTYGMCASCDKEIAKERLAVFPEMPLCKDCSEKQVI